MIYINSNLLPATWTHPESAGRSAFTATTPPGLPWTASSRAISMVTYTSSLSAVDWSIYTCS